jgi:hypothetical protein
MTDLHYSLKILHHVPEIHKSKMFVLYVGSIEDDDSFLNWIILNKSDLTTICEPIV